VTRMSPRRWRLHTNPTPFSTARKMLDRLPIVRLHESSFEKYALEMGARGDAATSAERPGLDLVPFVAMPSAAGVASEKFLDRTICRRPARRERRSS
jgi:hypothetical protein